MQFSLYIINYIKPFLFWQYFLDIILIKEKKLKIITILSLTDIIQ